MNESRKFYLMILFFLITWILHAQNGKFIYTDYGQVVFNYPDSLRIPKTLQELIPDLPNHDSIKYDIGLVAKGNCAAFKKESSDNLNETFQEYLEPKNHHRFLKFRTVIWIMDIIYYVNGVPLKHKPVDLIFDDQLRLREWIKK